jgi:hypothetical protein
MGVDVLVYRLEAGIALRIQPVDRGTEAGGNVASEIAPIASGSRPRRMDAATIWPRVGISCFILVQVSGRKVLDRGRR